MENITVGDEASVYDLGKRNVFGDEYVCKEGKERETYTIRILCEMTNQSFIN